MRIDFPATATTTARSTSRTSRLPQTDQSQSRLADLDPAWIAAWALAIACAVVLVLLGAGGLDLGAAEARLGLAAGGRLGPFGQVYGYWAPDLWPVPVAVSQLWSLIEENGRTTAASIRWPAAIAGVVAGLLLAFRLMEAARPRTGVFFALCWFGSLALIDRSSSTGLDFLLGLAIVAALDRMLSRGSDWIAGLWGAVAFLSGGWPPLVILGLAIVVIGRKSAGFSHKLIAPPLIAAAVWSAWAVWSAPVEAWASALTLPLTAPPAWGLGLGVVGIGLPWILFAPICATLPVRRSSTPAVWILVKTWGQIALAAVIAGTLIPGLATAARFPALVGLLIAAAVVLDAAWDGALDGVGKRIFFGASLALVLFWLVAGMAAGLHFAFNVPYYRAVGVFLVIGLIPIVSLGFIGFENRDARRIVASLAILTLSLKLIYSGYYAPEWNYRRSQGPWGRAVGQWIMPRWPVYTFHDWSPDLGFAIGRPVRQLKTPQHLAYEEPNTSKFVLLLESEYLHWPDDAPKLNKLTQFFDESGGVRVVARTNGYLPNPFGARESADK